MAFVSTREYISALREAVRNGRTASILVAGSSMAPFLIHDRDYVTFRAPDRPLRRGDIVFYERDSGQFVMHRILRVHKERRSEECTQAGGLSEVRTFDIAGDNQTVVEKGVREDQIFALITEVKRKGKALRPGDFWWEFFARVWPALLPVRRPMQHAYSIFIGRWKRKEEESDNG